MASHEAGFQLNGKNLLITGGDSGIGRGIALRFATEGVNVAFTWHKNTVKAKKAEELLNKTGVSVVSLQCDVQTSSEVQETVNRVVSKLGCIDILINNAGIYPVCPLLDMPEHEWDETIGVNLKGVHLMSNSVASHMMEQENPGTIINIASIEGEDPAKGHVHYDASKGGVLAYTKAAALELSEMNIRVNAVSPGLIWNEGIEESWPEGVSRYLKAVPLGRLGMPEDIADACLFLASPLARWITGINLRVDGGLGATQRY